MKFGQQSYNPYEQYAKEQNKQSASKMVVAEDSKDKLVN
jgi:hypothetical protein